MSLESKSTAPQGMKRILVVGILFFLPFFVLVWINDQVIRGKREESTRENAEQLNQIVAHFSRLAQPLTYYQEIVGRVKRALIWGEDPAPILSLVPTGILKFYSFDRNGKRTRIPGFEEGMKNVSEQCLEFIRNSARQRGWQMTLKERSRAESFFGNSSVIETLARNPGKLIGLEFFGLPKNIGVFPFRDRKKNPGFILVSLENLKIAHFDLAKQALEKISKLAGPGFDFGFIDLENQHPDQTIGMDKIHGVVRQKMISASSDPLITYGNKIWSMNILSRKFILFGRCPEIPPLESFMKRQGSFLCAGMALFLFILILQEFLVKRGVSVRIQVLVLFSLAGAGSILTLFGFARAYIEIRQKTLLRERYAQTREVLEKIDNSFPFYQEGLAEQYTALCKIIGSHIKAFSNSGGQSGKIPGQALSFLRRLPKSLAVSVFDDRGEISWRRYSEAESNLATLYGKDYLKVVSRIAKLAMECFNGVIIEGGIKKILTSSKESPYVKQSAKWLHGNLGRIYDISFGKGKFSVFLNYFISDEGFAKGGIWITHVEGLIERSFLDIVQKRQKRYEFAVLSRDYSLRLIPLKKNGFPARRRKGLPWAAIHDFHDLISQVKIPVFRKETIGEHPILLSGISGKKLQDYNLVLITSLGNLERETTALFHEFLGFSLLIIIFAISLGLVFSEILLEPIQGITESLIHLSESHFSTPVKIRTGDELQLVGDGINEILEEMGELSIAKSIQEHLFPSEPLCLQDWHCRGWSRSHSEIGGEIFDYLELPQDHLLMWMAGVPGHSIASALVLAMAKMAARTLVDLKYFDSAGLYDELNLNLRRKTRGFEGGELLVGVFDRKSGVLKLTGNGKFLVGKNFSERQQGTVPEKTGEAFLLSSDQSGSGDLPACFSHEMNLLSGERCLVLSKGCWDAEKPPEAIRKAMNEFLSKFSGVRKKNLGDVDIWLNLNLLNPSGSKFESQSILMLEGKES